MKKAAGILSPWATAEDEKKAAKAPPVRSYALETMITATGAMVTARFIGQPCGQARRPDAIRRAECGTYPPRRLIERPPDRQATAAH